MMLCSWIILATKMTVILGVKMDKATIEDLKTPHEGLDLGCGYEACPMNAEGMLNVHIVPHTHGDLGGGLTFKQRFTGKMEDNDVFTNNINMKRILDFTISELWENNKRKFTMHDIPYFFHWWSKRDGTVHRMVYQMLRSGQLHIVGGGWGMPDESCTSYHALIDNFTHALRKLNRTLGTCARPLVAWQSEVYGHSREFTALAAMMGLDGLFINPISFEDELDRMGKKELEMIWRGSDDLGTATDLFTHKLFDGYWAPPGFCFATRCNDSLLVTSDSLLKNADDRALEFIKSAKYRQGANYATNHIMVVMGKRMGYHDAQLWFKNIDTLIESVNAMSITTGAKVTAAYSTPACYLKAVHDSGVPMPTKQDDFISLSYDKLNHFTGLFTSRPTIKYMAREAHVYLQMAKQMYVLAKLSRKNLKYYEELTWITGVFQDHYIISGTMIQEVKDHYTHKMYIAVQKSTILLKHAFNKLRRSPMIKLYYRCAFNVSSCKNTNAVRSFVVVYNPLAWPVTVPIRLPVIRFSIVSRFVVYNHKMETVRAVMVKIPTAVMRIPNRKTNADHELVFMADKLPAMGFRSYYIESVKMASHKGKRSIIKKLKKNKNKKYITRQTDQLKIDDKSMLDTLAANTEVYDYGDDVEPGELYDESPNGPSEVASSTTAAPSYVETDITSKVTTASGIQPFEEENDLFKGTNMTTVASNDLETDITFKVATKPSQLFVEENELFEAMKTTTEGQRHSEADVTSNITMIPTAHSEEENELFEVMKTTTKATSYLEADMTLKVTTKPARLFVDENKVFEVVKTTTTAPSYLEADVTSKINIKPTRPFIEEEEELFEVIKTTTAAPSYVEVETNFDINLDISTTTESPSYVGTEAKDTLINLRVDEDKHEGEIDPPVLRIDNPTRAPKKWHPGYQHPYIMKTSANINKTASRARTKPGLKKVTPIDEADHIERRKFFDTRPLMKEKAATASASNTTTSSTTEYYDAMNDPYLDEAKNYYFRTSTEKFIRNKYVKVHLDGNNLVTQISLLNGIQVALTIQMYYYVSDDPEKLSREVERRPGVNVFRPMDPAPVKIKGHIQSVVYKTYIVEEVQYSIANWAGFVVRLYVDRPVVEIDWVVGPVPSADDLGKDIFIRYTTDLVNNGIFYTDSNGRQTVKRIRNLRPSYDPIQTNIPSNIYPVTSKIYIEDTERNIRFSVFNDRSQGGTSLKDGQIDLMIHRKILTDENNMQVFLNESEYGQGIVVRGKHYLYLSKADYKPNKIFEKKFAKEVELAPQIFACPHNIFGGRMKEKWSAQTNEFHGVVKKLPVGVHVLTLQEWNDKTLLLRLENYLELADVIKDGVRTVFVKDLFANITIDSLRETTLGGNVWMDDYLPLQWNLKAKFVKNFNEFYGGNGSTEYSTNQYYEDPEKPDIERGIKLVPQQIRTFVATYH